MLTKNLCIFIVLCIQLLQTVPVLLKEFGIPIQNFVNAADDGKFKSCRFGQSACSPDVAVAVCETEDDGKNEKFNVLNLKFITSHSWLC